MASSLTAGEGLALIYAGDGSWRLAWGHKDWLGPIGAGLGGAEVPPGDTELASGEDDLGPFERLSFDVDPLPVRASVRAYLRRPVLVFRLDARADLSDLASGEFERPNLVWPWLHPAQRDPLGLPKETRAFGHQYTEFALPTFSDASLARFFLLGEPRRPAVVEPLMLIAPGGRCLMLAPLDAFHEQIIAVPRGAPHESEGVRCGWHGDLDVVPAGFGSELAIWAAPGPRRALEGWGRFLRDRHLTRRPSRYADDAVGKLSYWTDNGSAYWYRTAPGLDMPGTLEAVTHGLDAARVPARAVELDSWFYRHEITRELNPVGRDDVPPTGALRWEPREDALPDGVLGLRERIGGRPLILHSRHFSSRSSYFERHLAWIDRDRAHPRGPELFEALMAQAEAWGAIQYEQDWLVESFLGVRGLREAPGRARAWQESLDRAAGEHGQSLLLCMATPADFMQSVTLDHVAAIRTSGDYRYRIGSGALWAWFLYGNALARALGLASFKDVFLSSDQGEDLDGDPHAEVEALLSALSAGPVGIGDRVGRTDAARVLRTCRPDGVLVKPDVPLAALDRCFREHAALREGPLLGETYSLHPAGRWVYLVALHASRVETPIDFTLPLADLGDVAPRRPVQAYDWRTGAFHRLEPSARLTFQLEHRDWRFRILCPILESAGNEIAIFGDVGKFASVGDRRLRDIRRTERGIAFDVLGSPHEAIEIQGWSASPLSVEQDSASLQRDPDARWTLRTTLPPNGRREISLG